MHYKILKSQWEIAGYTTKLVESLPKELKSNLPTTEEIEAELEKVLTADQEKK